MIQVYQPKGNLFSIYHRCLTAPWLLLLHVLPPQPDYFRVKIWRRLRKLGAVAIKNSVYALPNNSETREDFEWLVEEIVAGGGEAMLCEATFLSGLSDESIMKLWRDARVPDALLNPSNSSAAVRAVRHRSLPAPRGVIWVTRRDIHVDRIASAWLIRRAIDTEAHFKFVTPTGYVPLRGERRFDMYDAEYGHVGSNCTFETLLNTFAITDSALRAIAEVVHDLDLKDGLYQRDETAGVARQLAMLYETDADDYERVLLGGAIFEDLYATYQRINGA